MLTLNAGIDTVLANTTKRKQALDDNSSVCSNQLSWLIEDDSHISNFSNGFLKFFMVRCTTT